MMWPTRENERRRIATALAEAKITLGLKGLPDAQTIDTLALQFIASLRREDYYKMLQRKAVGPRRADPSDPLFDAERAVAFHVQQGNIDDAGWLIFLMTHFARHPATKWRRLRDVYGALGTGLWDWPTVTKNAPAFYEWMAGHWQQVGGSFGNHRKYESLRPTANRPFSRAVADYLTWIGPAGHARFFAEAVREAGNDPHTIFDRLYQDLAITSFGRLAKFDYLSLIGRYEIAPVSAGSAYLSGATGPTRGAKLLVDGNVTGPSKLTALQDALDDLDVELKVGMEVMEDALCNWQKSPKKFIHFTG